MPTSLNNLDQVVQIINEMSAKKSRLIIGIVGCPGAGKSTLSDALKETIPHTNVVQMDGFHLTNEVLEKKGLLQRKGSPETFDLGGFKALLERLKNRDISQDETIYAPKFDRELDASIGSAIPILATDKCIIVEGNYLLLDKMGWRDLKPLFDLTLFLAVDESTLISRLMQRWLDLGLDENTALKKVQSNDLLNIQLVSDHLLTPDVTLSFN